MNNYINIINELSRKQVAIDKEKQYIFFSSSYNYKYKCYKYINYRKGKYIDGTNPRYFN